MEGSGGKGRNPQTIEAAIGSECFPRADDKTTHPGMNEETKMADVPSNVAPATKSFLGKEMYLVVTRPVRSPEIAKRLGDHLAHQIELEKRGIMFAAGPLYPRGSETPEAGMFVLRASSFEEAEAIAKEDPLHKAGLRTFTLQKWRVNEGRITVTVDFSDQTMKIE